MGKIMELTGETFGDLEVVSIDRVEGRSYWLCKCKCGSVSSIAGSSLVSGNTKSCGCLMLRDTKTIESQEINQEEIKKILEYNPETGVFIWIKVSRFHKEKTGSVAGTSQPSRGKIYIKIGINGRSYAAHRLAWLYMYGYLPKCIDHMNGDSTDNRICNLNEVTVIQNAQNHTLGEKPNGLPLGVSRCSSGYRARITASGVCHSLGVFETTSEASDAYELARDSLHYAPSRFGHV